MPAAPRLQETEADRREAEAKEDVGLMPLGIPMLAGPGAISTVMVLMGQTKLWWQAIPIIAAIAATSVTACYTLAFGSRMQRILGETGIPDSNQTQVGANRYQSIGCAVSF